MANTPVFTLKEIVSCGMLIVGGSASSTVKVKVSVAVFPSASDAVQVTIVTPIGNVEPEAGSQVRSLAAGLMKVAVTSNVTAVPDGLVEVVDMLDGTVMVGGVVSVV